MAKVTKPKIKMAPGNTATPKTKKAAAAKKPAADKKRKKARVRRTSVVLTLKEQRTLEAMTPPNEDDSLNYLKLEEIAQKAFGHQRRGSSPKSQGNSWVRNSMRKLTKLRLVVHKKDPEKVKTGLYARTKLDASQLVQELEEDGVIKPEAAPEPEKTEKAPNSRSSVEVVATA